MYALTLIEHYIPNLISVVSFHGENSTAVENAERGRIETGGIFKGFPKNIQQFISRTSNKTLHTRKNFKVRRFTHKVLHT